MTETGGFLQAPCRFGWNLVASCVGKAALNTAKQACEKGPVPRGQGPVPSGLWPAV